MVASRGNLGYHGHHILELNVTFNFNWSLGERLVIAGLPDPVLSVSCHLPRLLSDQHVLNHVHKLYCPV